MKLVHQPLPGLGHPSERPQAASPTEALQQTFARLYVRRLLAEHQVQNAGLPLREIRL